MRLPYRMNLSAKSFPFLTSQHGETVIQKGYDQTFERSLVSRQDPDRDIGIPQVYYIENALPSATGFFSVDYVQEVAAFPGGGSLVDAVVAQVSFADTCYVGVTATLIRGQKPDPDYYSIKVFCSADSASWNLVLTTTSLEYPQVSVATVAGVCYLCVSGIGVWTVDSPTVFTPSVFTGLVMTNILGIVAHQGYMLAATASAFYWSSSVDPTDFTPSLSSGSGGGNVEQRVGNFRAFASSGSGVFLQYQGNVVYAAYSTNERYPFILREIPDAGGWTSNKAIARGALQSEVLTYTTSGIQELSPAKGADSVFPDASDYLSSGKYEVAFGEVYGQGSLTVGVEIVGDRFKCFSHGKDNYLVPDQPSQFLICIIYDSVLQRWGRLKVAHAKVLTRFKTSTNLLDSFVFVGLNGTIKTIRKSYGNTYAATSKIVLGKFRFVRQAQMFISDVTIEQISSGALIDAYVGVDYSPQDMITRLAEISYSTVPNGGELMVGESPVGDRLSVMIEGKFDLNTCMANFVIAGDT